MVGLSRFQPAMTEHTTPTDAVELYLDHRRGDLASASLQSHEYRLNPFLRWCEREDIQSMETLSGRDLAAYKAWRRDDGNLAPATLKTQMDTIRVFIRFCESIEAVPENLHEKVLSPTLKARENQRDERIKPERAKEILSFLGRYRYASLGHVIMALLWRTGIRLGGIRGIDLNDYKPDRSRIELYHRPESDTPLKNQTEGERYLALKTKTCELLDDWIEYNRPDVTDDYGREPLLASNHGRLSRASTRRYVYRLTRPCEIGECPHGRNPDTCEATGNGGHAASKCPSSHGTHAIRRGSITHFLASDVPEEVVCDRMNVSRDVLDDHYDRRPEEQKVEQRRGYLNNV